MNKLSAVLITYNEENHINEVIENISFANEIVVVDSFSTDKTIELLANFNNVTIIQREFKNFTDQRNFALTKANHDWILFIDADERIPEKLKQEILNEINNPDGTAGFMFKRLFFFNRKRLRFSGFQTDMTFRLFKKGKVKYIENKLVHEIPKIEGKSKVLKNTMIHYCIDNAQHYKSKMEFYAKLKALELYKKGVKPNFYHIYIRPAYKFVSNYFLRFGFLDGKNGFTICYLGAYGVAYRYKELKKLNNI